MRNDDVDILDGNAGASQRLRDNMGHILDRDAMQLDGMRLTGSERMQAMELSRVLVQRGAKKVHDREGNRWIGLFKKPR